MKILFLPNYFYPERVASPYLGENIRQAYAEAGFDMVLYTPVPTRGITAELRNEYKNKLNEEMLDGRLKIRRFPMMREGRNPIQRAFRYFLCVMKQYRNALSEKDVDVLSISSTPPLNLLLVKWIKKKRPELKIVYNLQDIFPDSLANTGLSSKGSILWKIGRKMEDAGYRASDRIVVISEDFRKNIIEKGVPEEKIVMIRNWVDEKAVVDIPRENNILFDEYKLDRNKFYVCYSGNVGLTQNMDMLLDTAKGLSDKPEIGFIIVGDGAYRKQVEERINVEKIANVTMIPFQPYERISEVFSLGDCGLIISKANVGSNSVPSKAWSIMSASRPVLASFDKGSELDSIVTNGNCGICVEADNPEKFREAILNMVQDRASGSEMGRNGRKYIEENLTRKTGTSKWVEVMKDVCGN